MADNRVSREAVKAVLETVRLPDGTGLVSAGRVRSLVVEDADRAHNRARPGRLAWIILIDMTFFCHDIHFKCNFVHTSR